MNKKSLSALLKANSNIEWKERRIDSNEFSALWAPVLVYECSAGVEHRIGLTDSGVWSAEYSDNLHITNSEKYFAFLTVLEMQRSFFVSELKKCLSGLSLPEKIICTFPFDEVMHGCHEAWQPLGTASRALVREGLSIEPGNCY